MSNIERSIGNLIASCDESIVKIVQDIDTNFSTMDKKKEAYLRGQLKVLVEVQNNLRTILEGYWKEQKSE